MQAASLLKRAARHELSEAPFQEVQYMLQIGRTDVVLSHSDAFLLAKPCAVCSCQAPQSC